MGKETIPADVEPGGVEHEGALARLVVGLLVQRQREAVADALHGPVDVVHGPEHARDVRLRLAVVEQGRDDRPTDAAPGVQGEGLCACVMGGDEGEEK